MTVLRLRLPLPPPLAERAAADAKRRGLPLPAWVAEVVVCHLADAGCQHIGRLPVPDDGADPDDDEPGPRLPAAGQSPGPQDVPGRHVGASGLTPA